MKSLILLLRDNQKKEGIFDIQQQQVPCALNDCNNHYNQQNNHYYTPFTTSVSLYINMCNPLARGMDESLIRNRLKMRGNTKKKNITAGTSLGCPRAFMA